MSNKPDYEKIESSEAAEEEVVKHKDLVIKQVKLRSQLKENKKEAMSAYNEQLKECEESMDFHMEVIDELRRHKKLLLAKEDKTVPAGLKSVP